MSLHIRAAAPPTQGRLRQLILESLPQLLGNAAQALPSTGHLPVDTLVAVDAYQRLWVVSFTTHDAGRVLLDGLAAQQQVRDLMPWMRQVRLIGSNIEECSLLVLSPELPAGSLELCRRAGVDWRRLRFLEVNGELGLLIEPGEATAAKLQPPIQTAAPAPAQAAPNAPSNGAPNTPPNTPPNTHGKLTPMRRETTKLSAGEEAFFQHL